jgi:ankyrin repeat protein
MCSVNFENQTPLHLAAQNGRDNLVKYFSENGCNINQGDWTALLAAADSGQVEVSREFLKQLGCVATAIKNI